MDNDPFSAKKGLSFDLYQLTVCEHTSIVCENSGILVFRYRAKDGRL